MTDVPFVNPPGGTSEQLPAHLLALITLAPYTSTACQTAAALEAAAERIPANPLHAELLVAAARLGGRCRENQKFTGQLCASPYHDPEPDDEDDGAPHCATPRLTSGLIADAQLDERERLMEVQRLEEIKYATPRELELRQRQAWANAGDCPMCGSNNTDGYLCPACVPQVRRLPSHQRRQWDRYQPINPHPLPGHGYTPAGLLGFVDDVDADQGRADR